jgi:CspA family cold shock protein
MFEKEEIAMATGTIKKVVSDRGFGFIAADDGTEYFFHRDGLQPSVRFDQLRGGEKVSFDIEAGQKGPRAQRVQLG